jgi:hypothetical protein
MFEREKKREGGGKKGKREECPRDRMLMFIRFWWTLALSLLLLSLDVLFWHGDLIVF